MLDVAKYSIEIGAAHARFVAIHECVVAGKSGIVREQPRFFARQPHHLPKVFQKPEPVVGRALRAPRVLAARTCHGLGFHQRFRQRVGVTPVTPYFAQVGALNITERFLLRGSQPIRETRIGARAVDQGVEFRFRRGARLVALGRHHGVAVPADDGGEMVVSVDARINAAQFLISRCGGHFELSDNERESDFIRGAPAYQCFDALARARTWRL